MRGSPLQAIVSYSGRRASRSNTTPIKPPVEAASTEDRSAYHLILRPWFHVIAINRDSPYQTPFTQTALGLQV